jgi:hypothetical protein
LLKNPCGGSEEPPHAVPKLKIMMASFVSLGVSARHGSLVYTSILGQNSKKLFFGNPPILPTNRSCGQSRRARVARNGNVGCVPPVQVEKVVIVMTLIIAEMEHHCKRRRRVYASGLASTHIHKPTFVNYGGLILHFLFFIAEKPICVSGLARQLYRTPLS